MKKNIVKSHLKKKAQSKLALSISLFIVLLTSTGYIFKSEGIIFVYSKYIKSGILPLALALEYNGYQKKDGSLISDKVAV